MRHTSSAKIQVSARLNTGEPVNIVEHLPGPGFGLGLSEGQHMTITMP